MSDREYRYVVSYSLGSIALALDLGLILALFETGNPTTGYIWTAFTCIGWLAYLLGRIR